MSKPEEYLGPYGSAKEALKNAAATSVGNPKAPFGTSGAKVRIAKSTPNGDFTAIQVGSVIRIRRNNQESGHAGSVKGSGSWLTAEEEKALASLSWRPI